MTAWLRLRRGSNLGPDPQQAAACVAALPGGDPFAALAQVLAFLHTLGSTRPASVAASQEVLELLDHAAHTYYRDATRRYLRDRGRVSAPRLTEWSTSVADWLTQLAQRYQSHVVLWRANANKHALAKDVLVRAIAGGVRACADVLKWGYLRQTSGPLGVWADMCTLYATAEIAACTRMPVVLTQSAGETSVEREFLKACILAAAGPQALSPEQVDVAERLAGYCAGDLGLAPGHHPAYRYWIDLESGEPPRELHQADTELAARARCFGLQSDQRLRRLLHLVGADRLPPGTFGGHLDKAALLDTLAYLAQRWVGSEQPDALVA